MTKRDRLTPEQEDKIAAREARTRPGCCGTCHYWVGASGSFLGVCSVPLPPMLRNDSDNTLSRADDHCALWKED